MSSKDVWKRCGIDSCQSRCRAGSNLCEERSRFSYISINSANSVDRRPVQDRACRSLSSRPATRLRVALSPWAGRSRSVAPEFSQAAPVTAIRQRLRRFSIASCHISQTTPRAELWQNPAIMAGTAVTLNRREHICDFCSDPNPVSVLQCEDFVCAKFSDLPHLAAGAWSACDTCAGLIEHENWRDLADRATEALCRENSIPR